MQCSDSSGDLWGIVDFRKRVPPRPIDAQMLLHILDEVPHAFASVIAGAFVVDITKRPLNWISPWTVGR